eukprot:scaffold632138_cov29-Prasinocladus_malaysianus.AAC.1
MEEDSDPTMARAAKHKYPHELGKIVNLVKRRTRDIFQVVTNPKIDELQQLVDKFKKGLKNGRYFDRKVLHWKARKTQLQKIAVVALIDIECAAYEAMAATGDDTLGSLAADAAWDKEEAKTFEGTLLNSPNTTWASFIRQCSPPESLLALKRWGLLASG